MGQKKLFLIKQNIFQHLLIHVLLVSLNYIFRHIGYFILQHTSIVLCEKFG